MKTITRNTFLMAAMATSFTAFSAQASSVDGLGIGLGYGAFSGSNLELSYPITDTLQVRGALASGMKVSETSSDTDIEYDVESSGGINRIALDYHPFSNGFFLSAGYSMNSFELDINGSGTGTVEIGNVTYDAADITIDGNIAWQNAPSLSLGWGHSPAKGLGFMLELGAYFTGAANAKLDGTCTPTIGIECIGFDDALKDEEKKLQDDVADFEFLPVLQAGITYRF